MKLKVKSLQLGIACFKCKKTDSSLHIERGAFVKVVYEVR